MVNDCDRDFILLAFLVSITVDWFSELSTVKAAQLDPVEAIRYE